MPGIDGITSGIAKGFSKLVVEAIATIFVAGFSDEENVTPLFTKSTITDLKPSALSILVHSLIADEVRSSKSNALKVPFVKENLTTTVEAVSETSDNLNSGAAGAAAEAENIASGIIIITVSTTARIFFILLIILFPFSL